MKKAPIMTPHRRCVYVLAVCSLIHITAKLCAASKNSNAFDIYPIGDPRRCLSNVDKGINILEVLPGSGWDNLQNTEAGMVLAHNYSNCRMTEDQRYIIPDSTIVYTMKTYLWQSNAEVIDSSSSGVSITAQGINLDSHYDGEFDISGAFAGDNRQVNTHNTGDMSITNRIQRRYVGYRAAIQPEMPLSSSFRLRLLNIADYLHAGDVRLARYASQQLVREFGTHVIVGVQAGTVWIQDESVSNEVLNTSSETRPSLSASPSLSITTNISQVHLNASGYGRQHSRTNSSTINNSSVTLMRSFGGNPVAHPNMSEQEWVESFSNNLVAVDRTGEPIDTLVQAEILPELTIDTVMQLNSMVKEAIQTYYKINTYPGCTDKNAANFSPEANADDGSCRKQGHLNQNTTIRFGGVFQTCNVSGDDDTSRDPCTGLRQVNPSTGLASCPEGYETIPMYRNTVQHFHSTQHCTPCWMDLLKCCQDLIKTVIVESASYWCLHASYNTTNRNDLYDFNKEEDTDFDEKELPDFPGFLFGGTFTSQIPNFLTSAKTCPRGFLPLNVAEDVSVCVSDAGEEAANQAVNFAGFFSCSAGNPLSVRYTTMNSPLLLHTYSSGPSAWPKQCPRGYSPYMTAIMMEDGCEIYHCIQPRTARTVKPRKLRRPPFAPATSVKGSMNKRNTRSLFKAEHYEDMKRHVHGDRSHMNIQLMKASGNFPPNNVEKDKEDNMVLVLTFNTSNIFVMTIFVGLLLVIGILIFFKLGKLKKRRGKDEESEKMYNGVFVKS